MIGLTRFKRWRASRTIAFDDEPVRADIFTKIDAAEYELRCIVSDVSQVRLESELVKSANITALRQSTVTI
jgi:hypothetical protein